MIRIFGKFIVWLQICHVIFLRLSHATCVGQAILGGDSAVLDHPVSAVVSHEDHTILGKNSGNTYR